MSKVLLVEDDNNLREIYEARLQAEGYDIASARDGEEALVVAKEQNPDLVISDVMMPKISGFEMLDILRNTDGLKDVKVIMLTALGQSEDQQRANRLGADRYLVKSQVTLEDIVTAARELLDPVVEENPLYEPALEPTQSAPQPEPTPQPMPALEPTQSAPQPEPTPQPMPAPEPTQSAPQPEPTPQPMPAPEPTQSAPQPEPTPLSPTDLDVPPTPPASNESPYVPTQPSADQIPTDAAPSIPPEPILVVAPPTMPAQTATPVEQSAQQLTETVPQPIVPAPLASTGASDTLPSQSVAAGQTNTDIAQSTNEEAASVEAQIESFFESPAIDPFVAQLPNEQGIGTEATVTAPEPPAPMNSPVQAAPPEPISFVPPALPVSMPIEPAPVESNAETSAPITNTDALNVQTSNDQTMDHAMDSLAAGTDENIIAPTSPPVSSTTVAEPSEDKSQPSAIAGKKVISPLGLEPLPDLEALLAKEQAKSDSATPGHQPGEVIGSNNLAEPFDPNSIAL